MASKVQTTLWALSWLQTWKGAYPEFLPPARPVLDFADRLVTLREAVLAARIPIQSTVCLSTNAPHATRPPPHRSGSWVLMQVKFFPHRCLLRPWVNPGIWLSVGHLTSACSEAGHTWIPSMMERVHGSSAAPHCNELKVGMTRCCTDERACPEEKGRNWPCSTCSSAAAVSAFQHRRKGTPSYAVRGEL